MKILFKTAGLAIYLLTVLAGYGRDLKASRFTEVVNDVQVFSAADKTHKPAVVTETFSIPDVIRTGPVSRAELEADDKTITRIGSSSIFSFDQANRAIDLQQGSLLFHSPHGRGGGTIRSGSSSASVLGTTIICVATSGGGFKVLTLEGTAAIKVSHAVQTLEAGQMVFVLPGGQLSPLIAFRLDDLVRDSQLIRGFAHPLPSMGLINRAISAQHRLIQAGRAEDTGLLVGNEATHDQIQVLTETLPQLLPTLSLGGGTATPVPGSPDSGVNPGTVVVPPPDILPDQTTPVIVPPPVGAVLGGIFVPVPVYALFRNPFYGIYNNNNINIKGPTLDLTLYNNVSGYIDIAAAKHLQINKSLDFTGLLLLVNALYLSGGERIDINNGSVVQASIGYLQLSSGGTDGNAMKLKDVTIRNNGGDLSLICAGTISLTGGAVNSSGITTLYAGDGVLLDSTGVSGNTFNVYAQNTADLKNLNLNTLGTVNMDAHTINLLNVGFAGGSTVNLQSSLGLLAPNPNTGQVSSPGYVNFINGVTYGGQPAQNYVAPGGGSGIHIFARPGG